MCTENETMANSLKKRVLVYQLRMSSTSCGLFVNEVKLYFHSWYNTQIYLWYGCFSSIRTSLHHALCFSHYCMGRASEVCALISKSLYSSIICHFSIAELATDSDCVHVICACYLLNDHELLLQKGDN